MEQALNSFRGNTTTSKNIKLDYLFVENNSQAYLHLGALKVSFLIPLPTTLKKNGLSSFKIYNAELSDEFVIRIF